MRCFKHIAELVKNRREELGLSQFDVSKALGYKNSQFISNNSKLQTKIWNIKKELNEGKPIDYCKKLQIQKEIWKQ